LDDWLKRARKDDPAVQAEVFVANKSGNDWSKRERTRRAIERGVFSHGANMLDAYADLWLALRREGLQFVQLAKIDWNQALGWIRAVVRDAKVKTTDDGSFASLILTDGTGIDLRCRFEAEELRKYEKAINRSTGKVILIRAAFNDKSKALRGLQVYDAATLHKDWRNEKLTEQQQRIFENPLSKIRPRSDLRRASRKEAVSFVGQIEAVKLWKDKRGHQMAFFDVAAYRGSVSVACFGSSMKQYQRDLYAGAIVRCSLVKSDRGTWTLDHKSGCKLKSIDL
jgi:DNA polymerase III alpha subunit